MFPAAERVFFDRIREAPAADAPRLIYADWLDEHGQPARAEFVRLQCALARLPADDPRRGYLRDRERALADAHEEKWKEDLAGLASDCVFRRGVIDSVSVEAGRFLAHGAELFDRVPVCKIRFLGVGERLADLVRSRLLGLVRELDLSGNDLGDRGPTLLARSVYLDRLDTLDLGFTDLGDAGLTALAGSPVFSRLRSLRIGGNSLIGMPGTRALADSPYLTELIDLDVSGNGLAQQAVLPILEGPPGRRLWRLALQENSLGDVGTVALARTAVLAHTARRDRVIDLRRVGMGPVGAAALAGVPALAAIETLDLDSNLLGDAGLAALAESPYLGELRVLSVRENRISDDGVRVLARSPLMASLRVLDLSGNLVTQDSVDRLHEASVAYDWRGLLQVRVDSNLSRRQFGPASRGLLVRRPSS